MVLDKYTVFTPQQQKVIYNWFQHYSVDSLQQELEQAGLKLKAVYADVAGTAFDDGQNEFAVVASKT